MQNKAQAYAELAEQTAKRLTDNLSSWTRFLNTVGRLYKYPYYEQLMIYAQRPDATACANFDLWNKTMNRYVRRGSKGIALIDPTGGTKLKYVFDVSDTGGRENPRSPYLWKMEEHHTEPILKMLNEKYNKEEINLYNAFYSIANDIAKEYYSIHQDELSHIIKGSLLEKYDEVSVFAAFKLVTMTSIAYTLAKRCGLDTDQFEENDFFNFSDFDTVDTVTLLGTAVSELSEQIFRQIAVTIAKTDHERSNENERNHLQQKRGLSDTRHHIDTTRNRLQDIGQVWADEETISHGTSDIPVQFPATERETVLPLLGNRPDSEQAANTDNERLTENADTSRQDDTADGMGRIHEQSEIPSGGNNTDGTNLQLTLFPTEQEQIQSIADRQERENTQSQSVFSMSQTDIDHILRTGGNRENTIFHIVSMYQKNKLAVENVAFLEHEFGEGGKGLYIGGEKVSVWYNKEGIHIAKGETALYALHKQLISWEDAEQRVGELLSEGQFAPQSALSDAVDYEYLHIAQTLCYLHQNFSEQNLLTYFDKDLFKGNFPSSSEHIAKLLKEPAELETIIADLQNFIADYEQDMELLRFHFPKPKELLSALVDLKLPVKEFSAVLTDVPTLRMFVTQDEVDKALAHDSSFEHRKYHIYDFFMHPHSPKEKADFLKNKYCIEGETHAISGAAHNYENYSAKGLEYKRGIEDDKLLLTWNTVAKRIDYLVANNRYLTAEEKIKFEEMQVEKAILENTTTDIPIVAELTQQIAEAPAHVQEPQAETLPKEITQMDIDSTLKTWNGTTVAENKFLKKGKIPIKHEQTENNSIPYSRGDTVCLENGMPFLIEEITDHQVTLRDPSLYYPMLRAESRESFSRLMGRYPQSETVQEKAEDFRITNTHLGEGGKREKFQKNIAAITTLQTIERENRPATKEEQEILSQYVGWGGLSEVFDKTNNSYASEFVQLKNLLSEDEYDMARASTLNAHYTSPTVIKSIYDTVERMGFTASNILEPACGTGHFFGMLPDSMKGSNLYGIELDSITGRIAKQLYPSANVTIIGFEKTDLPDSFFDLAIGNVPFGNYKLNEKRYNNQNFLIHDHFFAKALDKVRPGGIVAFVTSKGTMDKKNSVVRRYLAQRAELLGAVRLPNNTFLENAGTGVTSDILFLQKRDRPMDVDRNWIHLDTNEDGIVLNSYFADHPEMILGTMEMKSGQFGMESTCISKPDTDLAEQLQAAMTNIEGSIPEMDLPDMAVIADTSIPADPTVKNYSYTIVDGEVYYRENSRMVRPDLNQITKERIAGLVELRGCVNALIHYQLEDYSDDTIKHEQAKLNYLYDNFITKYGLINSRGNSLSFSKDNSYFLLCSLEDVDENGNLKAKADIFTKRTIKKRVVITSVDTASEALALSIAEKVTVDLEYMSKLTGLSAEQLIIDLRGVIFRLPTLEDESSPHFVTANEYLSGNVREKLHIAKLAAQTNEIYAINVTALEAAQPKDLDASEIDVRLGATWVDKEYIEQFMYELLDTPYYNQREIKVKFASFTAEWNITGKNSIDSNNVAAYMTYGTDRANAYLILEDTLNLRDIRIYDTLTDPDGKKRRVINKEATTLAQQKQQTIKDEFREWIWRNANRRQTLVKKYNEKFNAVRPREYDGQHIKLSGINPEISLRPHQINAIAHILYGNNTLLAHEVGAGKTFEMVAAVMESKRLGLCQKPLFVVPNHLTGQWASEFLRLYPAANILVATKMDFETKNRKKFCARIATGEYDAVIIGHSQFERIPVSFERQERLLHEQIHEILYGIEEVKKGGGESFTVKQLERTKNGLQERLAKLVAQERKDDVVNFEQLGVDRLYVDEAHNYKNLFLYTKMRNVAGLSTTDAQKSNDMFMKCRYMDELTGGKGIVFATGTPVSNSITELYTMQRYLQYSTLQKNGLAHFDCWASTFGETITAIELAPEGTGYRARTRFSKFFNLPELMIMFKEVADIKTADQLNLPTPKVIYETVVVKPTKIQQEMVNELSKRAAIVHAKNVDPSVDNMLKITSDGRKLGLDQRVINSLLPDEESSKVNACVNNLYRIWNEGAADKLTQLVFCDISTPKVRNTTPKQNQKVADASNQTINSVELYTLEDNVLNESLTPIFHFNVYDDIRNKLIEKGIPAEQVAFIHEANTEIRKKELFAKVRSGDVRVLIGSTAKCGAGTNIQDRLVASHDLDCPWRPGDLTQRSGRIERQGNMNEKVNIYRYVTEATFDMYLWQTVENKQKFISQIMTSKSPVRSCEDVDEAALSYAEIKALCAGNSLIKEKMDLDIEVARLKLLKANHQSIKYRLEDNLLKYFPENIEKNKGFIKGFEQDLQTLSAHIPAEGVFLPMVIKGDTLTDKDNAGAALLEACKEVIGEDSIKIGSYRGFVMYLSYSGFCNEFQLNLKGSMSHIIKLGASARSNLNRIDNVLATMPERLQALIEQLDNLYTQEVAAKAELDKPFLQEEELKNKMNRLTVLDVELNMDTSRPQEKVDKTAKIECLSLKEYDTKEENKPSILAQLKKSKEIVAPKKNIKNKLQNLEL